MLTHTVALPIQRITLQARGNLVPFPFLNFWYGAARLETMTPELPVDCASAAMIRNLHRI